MDQTREDRMRSRMRGAARHQVENADFGDLFAIPLIAPEPEPEPEPESESSSTSPPTVAQPQEPSPEAAAPPPDPVKRTSPNTSAKRRRLDSEGTTASSAPGQASSSARRSSRHLPRAPNSRDPYDPDNAPMGSDEAALAPGSALRSRASAPRSSAGRKLTSPRSAPQSQVPTPAPAPAPAPVPVPAPAPVPVPAPAPVPPQSSPLSVLRVEEVGESPADAPGSGHRRRVQASSAVGSSVRLQSAFQSVDGGTSPTFPQSSSPLSRKSIKSTGRNLASASSVRTGLRRSTRLSGSPDGDVNELSSDPPVDAAEDVAGADVSAEIPAADESIPEVAETVIDEPTGSVHAEEVEAQEIDDREAAQRLVHKRPLRRMPVPSPELSPDDASEEPVAKRPRKAPPPRKKSPAQQKQPKAPRAKQNKPTTERKKKNEDQAGPPIPVKIQRFTKHRRRRDEDSDDDDILNSTIPYTTRPGVNAVDFLAHTCERTIETSVNKIKEGIMNSQDAAEKKELRVKLRALEAFQQELQTRFLEHTIAIDTLFALKKRVREARQERLKLRDRIIQIRAEREQVALRMDAVRVKHDEESKEALHNINLSAAMHDVDLAIEQGLAAPELSAKDQKTADLASLELLISRITEQACSSGPGGGALGQIKSFNAFLERAAAVL